MQQISLQNCQSGFRGILLLSVLAGLLFSCGEGIRLFPFPPVDTTHKASFNRKSEEKILYQKNVHRFETKQENQSKFQRHHPRHWTGSSHAPSKLPFIASAALLKTGISIDLQPTKSLEISSSHGSRAPPVSESL